MLQSVVFGFLLACVCAQQVLQLDGYPVAQKTDFKSLCQWEIDVPKGVHALQIFVHVTETVPLMHAINIYGSWDSAISTRDARKRLDDAGLESGTTAGNVLVPTDIQKTGGKYHFVIDPNCLTCLLSDGSTSYYVSAMPLDVNGSPHIDVQVDRATSYARVPLGTPIYFHFMVGKAQTDGRDTLSQIIGINDYSIAINVDAFSLSSTVNQVEAYLRSHLNDDRNGLVRGLPVKGEKHTTKLDVGLTNNKFQTKLKAGFYTLAVFGPSGAGSDIRLTFTTGTSTDPQAVSPEKSCVDMISDPGSEIGEFQTPCGPLPCDKCAGEEGCTFCESETGPGRCVRGACPSGMTELTDTNLCCNLIADCTACKARKQCAWCGVNLGLFSDANMCTSGGGTCPGTQSFSTCAEYTGDIAIPSQQTLVEKKMIKLVGVVMTSSAGAETVLRPTTTTSTLLTFGDQTAATTMAHGTKKQVAVLAAVSAMLLALF